ncbi:FecR family protein [Plebeiibacterium sediminum]|uniref:FecR family protein n=1 Tax=Plebeiibacterium sediminum TaxID=2992112 RepID=A0AAE3SH71_9BACT|nr:FecR family protein [Plebeiobacterium sediminum]MCW3789238.1 FecR family protein [Plebeiobacterium sediminum]
MATGNQKTDDTQMRLLIFKYLQNKCNKQEFNRVYNLFSDNKQFEKYNDIWQELWNQSLEKGNNNLSATHKEEALLLIKDHKESKTRFINNYKLIRWAAVACLIIGIGWLIQNQIKSFNNDTYEAKYSQIQDIDLIDGSQVSLGSTSKLTVSKNFNKQNRDLSLEGMAFFSVAKDKLHPFTIQTEKMMITVVGTSFTIRSFNNEITSVVTVNTGKVKVNVSDMSNKNEFYLTPDKQLVFNKQTGLVNVKQVDSEKHKQWINKSFYYNKSPLYQVITDLQNMYHVQIKVNDSNINSLIITGEYSNKNLSEIINSICFVHNLKVEYKSEDQIIIYKPNH